MLTLEQQMNQSVHSIVSAMETDFGDSEQYVWSFINSISSGYKVVLEINNSLYHAVYQMDLSKVTKNVQVNKDSIEIYPDVNEYQFGQLKFELPTPKTINALDIVKEDGSEFFSYVEAYLEAKEIFESIEEEDSVTCDCPACQPEGVKAKQLTALMGNFWQGQNEGVSNDDTNEDIDIGSMFEQFFKPKVELEDKNFFENMPLDVKQQTVSSYIENGIKKKYGIDIITFGNLDDETRNVLINS